MSTVTKNTYDSTLLSAISEKLIELGWYQVNPSLLYRDGFFVCFKIFKGVIVYGKVDVKESAVGREMRIRKQWNEQNIFEQSIQNREGAQSFVFYEEYQRRTDYRM